MSLQFPRYSQRQVSGDECLTFAASSLVLFTTLTSSCRARYRIKSTRATFIQILIPRGVTRESCAPSVGRGEQEETLRKIKGARNTRNRCSTVSSARGEGDGKRARSCDIAKLRGGGGTRPCRSLEEALTNDGGNFYYFRCRPIRRGRLRPHEPRRRLDVFYIHFATERPPGRYAPPLTNDRGVLLDELFKILPRARTCGYTK